MSDKILQVPATIEKISTMVDGGNKITVTPPELTPEEMTILFTLKNKTGFMGYAERELQTEDFEIPEPGKEFSTDRSPSQRLRSVIYVYWEKNTNKSKTFDEFYRNYIDKIIEQIKEKLS